MKSAALIDKNLENELCRNGYVVIRRFIDETKVNKLYTLYKQHHPKANNQNSMWNSLYDTNSENGMDISRQIQEVLKPALDSIFESYYTPVATFMSKNNNENTTCDLHRDFSVADENNFDYRNIWIPLVSTSYQNGALFVVKGSNRVFDYVLPMFCEWPYKSLQSELLKLVDTVECEPGDLVIYLDKTLHGSHINRSQDSRPAVHFGALHPDVELLFYYLDNQTRKVRTYKVPYQFYFENNFSEPVGRFPLHSEFDYNPPSITMQDVLKDQETA
jgi:ectoine hydroxylase-related dioxygenase (phytanoyl-CoA dioxygenase family)